MTQNKGSAQLKFLWWTIRFSSVLFGLGMLCIIALTWFAAFFNGNEVTVSINDYRERDFELLMWIFLGPLFATGLVATAYQIYLERKKELNL